MSDPCTTAIAAVNKVREDPKSIIPLIEAQLTYFEGDVIYFPGSDMGMRTVEGPSALKEAIKFLNKQKSIEPLCSLPDL